MSYDKLVVEQWLQDNPDLARRNNAPVKPHNDQQMTDKAGKVSQGIPVNKRHALIKMAYIKDLSVNHYKYRYYTKPEVQEWKRDLIKEVLICGVKNWTPPLRVTINAFFKDNRKRDVQNFGKLIFDCVEAATGINDRYYHTVTAPAGKASENYILIKIEEV